MSGNRDEVQNCRFTFPRLVAERYASAVHDIAGGLLRDTRTGHNRLHLLVGLLRQSVFGRLAGYEDVNDADRLALDPVMRQVVGWRAVDAKAASASQMGRFETEVLATTDNRTALADMSGQWIDRFHERKPPKWITLDMDNLSQCRACFCGCFVFNENSDWNNKRMNLCWHSFENTTKKYKARQQV